MIRSLFVRIFIVSAVLLAPLVPCAWVDDGELPEQMNSFFDQSIVGDPLFRNFYPNSVDAISYFTDPPRIRDDATFSDWKTYFKSAYRSSPQLADIMAAVTNYSIFTRIAKADDAMSEYISYMNEVNKTLTSYQERRMQSWQPFTMEEKSKYTSLFKDFASRAVASASSVKNEFLALRYGFQAVRFAVLSEQYDDAIQYYTDLVAKRRGNTLIGYQALGYKARALYKKGDRVGALTHYLEIFDQCPPLMAQTLQSMYLMTTKIEFDAYGSKEPSKHKQTTAAFVWSFLQKRDYSRETLASVLDTNPSGSKPEIVLVRMIQTIEHEMWGLDRHQFTGGGTPKSDYDALIALCSEAGARTDIRQGALWYAAASYLSLLAGKLNDAEKHLTQASSVKKPSAAVADQMHCVGTMLALAKNQRTFAADAQKRLLDDIRWAERMSGSNPRIRDSLITLTAQRFLAANDIARAAAAFSIVSGTTAAYLIDCVSEDADLFVLEGLLAKRPTGATLDSFIFSKTPLSADDIICARGMKSLRKEDLTQALRHFERLSSSFNKKTPVQYSLDSPPIKNNATHIPSHDRYIAACAIKKTTFTELVKTLQYVQSLSEGGKGKLFAPVQLKGDPTLALGNIWFSLFLNADVGTYAGTASRPELGVQYDGFTPSSPSRFYAKIHEQFPLGIPAVTERMKRSLDTYEKEIDNFKKASRYYAKAMGSKDAESAARACANVIIAHGLYLHSDTKRDAVSREDAAVIGTLNTKFKTTKFYTDVIRECPHLGMYR
ncbi:MAG: hypothetical protein AABZ39_01235 [Spirochaetota bacterium]